MRQVEPISRHVQVTLFSQVILGNSQGLMDWVAHHCPEDASWLLAHCFQGVVWGKKEENQWVFSTHLLPDPFELSETNIVQLRVFGEMSELFLWREGAAFRARLLVSGSAHGVLLDGFIEDQWVWGTRDETPAAGSSGFTLLADGAQGLRHAVPIQVPKEHFAEKDYRPVRLRVEHYLGQDPGSGKAFVQYSRLAKIFSISQKEEMKR